MADINSYMEGIPEHLLREIMLDPYDMSDLRDISIDDLLPHYCDIPFTRNQHIVKTTHNFKSINGTKITINIDFKNKQHRFWRSHEGEVTTLTTDGIFFPTVFPFSAFLTYELEDNAMELWSPVKRHSLIRWFISLFKLTSLDVLAELEAQLSLCLLNAVSTSNDEGYSAFCADVVLEVATVDTYDEEEVDLATILAPESRSDRYDEEVVGLATILAPELRSDRYDEEEVDLATNLAPESRSCHSPI